MSKKILAMFLAIVLVLGTLPVLAISSAAEGDSGAVSDTINWAIDSSYNLTLTGTGAMPDYESESDRP